MAYNGTAYSGTAHTPAAAVTAAVAALEAAGTTTRGRRPRPAAASKVLGVLKLPVVKQQSLRSHTGLNWQRLSGSNYCLATTKKLIMKTTYHCPDYIIKVSPRSVNLFIRSVCFHRFFFIIYVHSCTLYVCFYINK